MRRFPQRLNRQSFAGGGAPFAMISAPPGKTSASIHLDYGADWAVDGPSGAIPVTTFDQDHGDIRSVGYRIGNVAYSSDVVGLPEASFEALAGVRIWIVDALRYRPHPTHATVEQALGWIERVKPERAILTNLHVDLDYETLKRELPSGVEPAYDGLSFTCEG